MLKEDNVKMFFLSYDKNADGKASWEASTTTPPVTRCNHAPNYDSAA